MLACVAIFSNGANEVSVKASGRAISRAVDVCEIVTRKILLDVKVKAINLGTQQFVNPDTRPVNVSTIEITLAK